MRPREQAIVKRRKIENFRKCEGLKVKDRELIGWNENETD